MSLEKVYPAPTRYYTNRERRRYNNKKKGRKVKMMAVNEILEPKTPVSLGEVFRMMIGKTRN